MSKKKYIQPEASASIIEASPVLEASIRMRKMEEQELYIEDEDEVW